MVGSGGTHQNLALAWYSVWRIRVYFTDIILVRVAARRSRRSRSCGARPGGVPTGRSARARVTSLCACVSRHGERSGSRVSAAHCRTRLYTALQINTILIMLHNRSHTTAPSHILHTGTSSHLCCYLLSENVAQSRERVLLEYALRTIRELFNH